jgi:hypothetical protein
MKNLAPDAVFHLHACATGSWGFSMKNDVSDAVFHLHACATGSWGFSMDKMIFNPRPHWFL